jgi:protein-S-isoprenylcysteine O-methyltransferase
VVQIALPISITSLRFLRMQSDFEMLFSMMPSLSMVLGFVYMLSELWLAISRRSSATAVSRDRKSLRILWIVILASVFFGIQAAQKFPWATLPHLHALRLLGIFLFGMGLALRWSAIWYLGKFFTVDVAVHSNHQLIETGPYRFIRHPSYTGALLAFLGLGFCLGNWWSLAIFILPVSVAFLLRIQVEERVLVEALGERYRLYQQRTKRLIPLLY